MERTIGFVKYLGLFCRGEILSLKRQRSNNLLTPIFEAFMNAWESVCGMPVENRLSSPAIEIELRLKNAAFDRNLDPEFESIIISDNGSGFDDESFQRFVNLRDNRKGKLNKGTGRLQFLRFFDEVQIESCYLSNNGQYRKCVFVFSDSDEFLQNNSFVKVMSDVELTSPQLSTKIRFVFPKNKAKEYSKFTAGTIKKAILEHFSPLLSKSKSLFPSIIVRQISDNERFEEKITTDDIPKPIRTSEFTMSSYSSPNVKNEDVIAFELTTFEYDERVKPQNAIFIATNGGIANGLSLSCMQEKDSFANKRYEFIVQSDYFDRCEGDERGNLTFPAFSRRVSREQTGLFTSIIPLELIEERVNEQILRENVIIHSEYERQKKEIERLQKHFLLSTETISSINFNANDNDEQILSKVYQADAKKQAKDDARLAGVLSRLEALHPSDSTYEEDLQTLSKEIAKTTSFDARETLATYVARRRIVLDVFERLLQTYRKNETVLEKEFHDLLMRRKSKTPNKSDLWVLSEDFVYFDGISDVPFNQMNYDGRKLFKDESEYTEDEQRAFRELDQNRLTKRPDILLFPNENKAIIIELKAPDVNLAKHLDQIDYYAQFILNYCADDFRFINFYGYLIGEAISEFDLKLLNRDYEKALEGDYWFRRPYGVQSFTDRPKGVISTEILKYSSLLQRAQIRNKAFQDRLFPSNKD